MPYQLLFFDEASKDIQEAKQWYKEQKEGLEAEFAEAIEQCIMKILHMPSAYAIRYKTIRIAHPKRFPFNIHFILNDTNNIVVITAIIHNKRHPRISKDRV